MWWVGYDSQGHHGEEQDQQVSSAEGIDGPNSWEGERSERDSLVCHSISDVYGVDSRIDQAKAEGRKECLANAVACFGEDGGRVECWAPISAGKNVTYATHP
jgi:hypothetical protein